MSAQYQNIVRLGGNTRDPLPRAPDWPRRSIELVQSQPPSPFQAWCGLVLFGLSIASTGCGKREEGQAATTAPSGVASVSTVREGPCGAESPGDCSVRALELLQGFNGQTVDAAQAAKLFGEACENGSARACFWSSSMYWSGLGALPVDEEQSAKLSEKACLGGDGLGCRDLAAFQRSGSSGVPKSDQGALQSLRKAIALLDETCKAGNAEDCNTLTGVYDAGGPGIAADKQKATEVKKVGATLRERECAQGKSTSCVFLGYHLMNGLGTEKDQKRALELWQTACKGGDAYGCNNLAVFYEGGIVLKKDIKRAAELYIAACNKGHGAACFSLGLMYAEGNIALKKDVAQAAAAYRVACNSGDARGCNNLGVLYRNGEGGLTKDPRQALALYQQACKLGSSMGCKNRRETSDKMRADETAEAFRKTLAVGDVSHCGLVVEVKAPIAKVQSIIGETWLKVEQLFPRGAENCTFHNRIYVDPRE